MANFADVEIAIAICIDDASLVLGEDATEVTRHLVPEASWKLQIMADGAFLTRTRHRPAFNAKDSPILIPFADEAGRFTQGCFSAESARLVDGHIEMWAPGKDLAIVIIIHVDERMLFEALIFTLGFEPICSRWGDKLALFAVLVKLRDWLHRVRARAIIRAVILYSVFEWEELGVWAAFFRANWCSLQDDAGTTEVGIAWATAMKHLFFCLEADWA